MELTRNTRRAFDSMRVVIGGPLGRASRTGRPEDDGPRRVASVYLPLREGRRRVLRGQSMICTVLVRGLPGGGFLSLSGSILLPRWCWWYTTTLDVCSRVVLVKKTGLRAHMSSMDFANAKSDFSSVTTNEFEPHRIMIDSDRHE